MKRVPLLKHIMPWRPNTKEHHDCISNKNHAQIVQKCAEHEKDFSDQKKTKCEKDQTRNKSI